MRTQAITIETPLKRQSRREEVLRQAIIENRPRLASVIRKLVRDQTEAEDVLQDVLAEFVEAYDLGTTIERVGAWLVTVARNKIFDRFRRKRTSNSYRESILQQPESIPPDGPTRSWLRKEIVSALELLPPEQRDVFVKHELEGKSFRQIMKETGAPLGTLLARKKYAVDFLRHHLKEVYDELES